MADLLEKSGLPQGLSDVLQRSSVPLTIASLTAPDCPLVMVNDKFCAMSGYAPHEMIDKNCRFLQPATGAGPVRSRIRAFLSDPKVDHDRFALANVRKGGEPFLNLLYLTKLSNDGKYQLVLGSQFDITNLTADNASTYDKSLAKDLRKTKELFRESTWSLIGSFTALAESSVAIAQANFHVDD
ncbi:PAS domain-containing protein [bacterium]|nr:PAS domain-containing protein [bacterium]